MSVDSIITQVTGGFDWKQLSWETLVRTLLVFVIGYVVMKMVLKTIDRIISHNNSLNTISRYLHSCLIKNCFMQIFKSDISFIERII